MLDEKFGFPKKYLSEKRESPYILVLPESFALWDFPPSDLYSTTKYYLGKTHSLEVTWRSYKLLNDYLLVKKKSQEIEYKFNEFFFGGESPKLKALDVIKIL